MEKLEQLKQIIKKLETEIQKAKTILEIKEEKEEPEVVDLRLKSVPPSSNSGKIIEGVFDGEFMIGPDGKKYPVPQNYASKSKLVEGDLLKLTIADDGSFIFKQIGPVEREKKIGTIVYEDDQYKVEVDGKTYKVLLASVTYFKLKPGDQATVLLPKGGKASWATIENAIISPESEKGIPLKEGEEKILE